MVKKNKNQWPPKTFFRPTNPNGFKIAKKRCITSIRKDFLRTRAVNPWISQLISLPSEANQAPTLNSFKAHLIKIGKDTTVEP